MREIIAVDSGRAKGQGAKGQGAKGRGEKSNPNFKKVTGDLRRREDR